MTLLFLDLTEILGLAKTETLNKLKWLRMELSLLSALTVDFGSGLPEPPWLVLLEKELESLSEPQTTSGTAILLVVFTAGKATTSGLVIKTSPPLLSPAIHSEDLQSLINPTKSSVLDRFQPNHLTTA